jgi:16S rRNA (uracil1498-N3)-methyltransferase
MHRFFLPPGETRGDELLLQGAEAHHALRVLRIEVGEQVTVLNGAGEALRCRVRETFRHELALVVEERRATPPVSHPVTLLQGVPKGKGMDAIVQKATELGVSRIVPLLSTNAVVHLDAAEARVKVEKWRRTALEAIKQCGLVWLPEIEMPQSPRAFLERGESHDLSLMAALTDAGRHPRFYFREYAAAHRAPPRSVAIWIGPEGDFSPAEVEAARAAGGKVISLGPWVLRSETAAIYALAVVQYELQAGDD